MIYKLALFVVFYMIDINQYKHFHNHETGVTTVLLLLHSPPPMASSCPPPRATAIQPYLAPQHQQCSSVPVMQPNNVTALLLIHHPHQP